MATMPKNTPTAVPSQPENVATSTAVQRHAVLPPAMVQTMQGLMPHVPALLPPDISQEQFRAALYLELSGRRDLAECTQESLRDCMIKAAMHGLLPGRDCHILPFRNKGQGGRRTATYVPNYFGIILALERTGKVAKAFAHPVYTGDEFVIDYLADVYKHIPAVALGTPAGALRFFYGCVRMKDGTTHIEVLDEAAIDAVRRRSPAHEHGPWVDDYLMMARKTALKRVAKYVRLTPEQESMFEEDEARERADISPERHRQNIVDLFGDDVRGSTIQAPPVADSETGEAQETSQTSPEDASPMNDSEGSYGQVLLNSWRDTLEMHKEDIGLSDALRAKVKLALNPASKTTDTKGFALASAVLDVLDDAKKRAEEGE